MSVCVALDLFGQATADLGVLRDCEGCATSSRCARTGSLVSSRPPSLPLSVSPASLGPVPCCSFLGTGLCFLLCSHHDGVTRRGEQSESTQTSAPKELRRHSLSLARLTLFSAHTLCPPPLHFPRLPRPVGRKILDVCVWAREVDVRRLARRDGARDQGDSPGEPLRCCSSLTALLGIR